MRYNSVGIYSCSNYFSLCMIKKGGIGQEGFFNAHV